MARSDFYNPQDKSFHCSEEDIQFDDDANYFTNTMASMT